MRTFLKICAEFAFICFYIGAYAFIACVAYKAAEFIKRGDD